jgi:hypothetical protein
MGIGREEKGVIVLMAITLIRPKFVQKQAEGRSFSQTIGKSSSVQTSDLWSRG